MKRATRRQTIAALAAAIVVVSGAGSAFAFWSVTSTGSGNASTGTLAAPVQTDPSDVTSNSAQVNWTAVTTGWQKDAVYTATVSGVGGQTCNAAASAGSCSLGGLVAGTTYTVTLTATFSSWTSGASNTKTVTPNASDTTAPSSVVTFPVGAAAYNATSWTAGCTTTNAICGTATDDVGGSGVKSVAVSVQATSGPNNVKYWNPALPAAFNSASEVKMAATYVAGNWTLPFPAANLSDATYSVRVYATDNANNTQASATLSQFTYDTTAPASVTVTAPAAGATVSGATVTASATATDANLSSIQLQYKLHTAVTWTNIGATGTSSPVTATWNVSGLTDGAYDVRAVASDGAGNQTTSATVAVSVANTGQPLSLSIANKAGAGTTAGQPEAGDTITVPFSTALQTASLCSASSWASPAGDTAAHTLTDVVVTISKGTGQGSNDTITFASATCSPLRFGTISLDAGGGIYASSNNTTFTGSTLAYSYSAATGNSVVTVTLGNLATGTLRSAITASHTATWTAASTLKGASGNALSPTSITTTAELF